MDTGRRQGVGRPSPIKESRRGRPVRLAKQEMLLPGEDLTAETTRRGTWCAARPPRGRGLSRGRRRVEAAAGKARRRQTCATSPPTPSPRAPAPERSHARALRRFGPWQVRTLLLVALVKAPSAWQMAAILFTSPTPAAHEFWCSRPHAARHHDAGQWRNYKAYEFFASQQMLPFDRGNATVQPCTEFEFNSSVTTVTQWNLVCQRQVLISVSQFFYLLGILVGGAVCTKLLTRVAPRRLLLAGMLVQIAAGIGVAFSTFIELQMFLRFLTAAACAHMFTAGWIPESPLWLLNAGQSTEAKAILDEATKYNDEIQPLMDTTPLDTRISVASEPQRYDLNIYCYTALHIAWAGTIVTYYGALLNVKNIGDHLFLYTGIADLATRAWIMLLIAMIARVSIAASLNMLTVVSAELLPKSTRQSIMFSAVTIARVCLLSAPFIGSLAMYGDCVSLSAFGALTAMAGFAVLPLQKVDNMKNFENNNGSTSIKNYYGQGTRCRSSSMPNGGEESLILNSPQQSKE
ncbi:uncharacterized protein GBIM_11047 [Gryllus bimaculatus]|nr:uncharacterized protein GBIM_11047 [Gryllus bimaculatus]